MYQSHRSLFVISLVALFALLLVASTTAAPTGQPSPAATGPVRLPAPIVDTASGETLDKLSPDLRKLAGKPDGEREVMITALLVIDAPTAPVQRLMVRSAASKPLGEVRWVTGTIKTANLGKLASSAGLIGVFSTETFKPVTAPGLDELRQLPAVPPVESLRAALLSGGKAAAAASLAPYRPQPGPARALPVVEATADVRSVKTADIHNVAAAHAKGYTGDGVVVAVVDSGVDFGNPDLQGTQARLSGGPYDGWPFAYDAISGINYALGELTYGPDNWAEIFGATYYVRTLPVEDPTCDGATCTGTLLIDYGSLSGWPWDPVELSFTWPNTSKSGSYFYSIHPDPYLTLAATADALGLGYGANFVPPALILADEAVAGQYDTVYVDLDFDQDLAEEIAMRRGAELAGTDLYDAAGQPGSDGVWDLSASMLTWIADGANPPPGVGSLYEDVAVPESGRLVAFVGDVESHGTNVAGMIAGQSVITDPAWVGPVNPLYAGAADIGGVGGPVAAGMAPDARVAALANGWALPVDAWVAAVVGFDGAPDSGDEAQLVNNSWGYSDVVEDGWDFVSRFGQYLNFTVAPTSSLLVATGNGGPGYGTTAMPNGSTIIGVGASTSFGSLVYWGLVTPPQFTYGTVIPWSNRGPGAQEAADPELVCVGAFGTGVNPLNVSLRQDADEVIFATGEGAYDAFGGTSMASPVCAGVGAIVYDAYRSETGNWPTFQQARDYLTAGATDLGYDAMTQGAGNANAGRSADIAAGAAVAATPTQWMVGDYRGEAFPAYIASATAGQSYQTTITVDNPTNAAANVKLADRVLEQVHEVTFTVTLPPIDFDTWAGQPNWLTDITALINQHNPDLVVAETVFPLDVFDPDGTFEPAVFADPHLYDWTDLNGDGNLWTDSNGDGFVDLDEIDIDDNGIAEYNIINYAAAGANNNMVSGGRDALDRRHDGVYLGLRGSWSDQTELTVNISLRFFRKVNWPWLSLSPGTVNVPAGGQRTVTATLAVPPNTRPGFYQGAIEYLGRVIPVTINVAAEGTEFDFGATTFDEPRGLQPFDNNHVSGYVDWFWRPETGDWRFFYYDVADGTAAPGKALLIDTRWQTADTDVDTHIFAAAPDDFSGALPDIFGPTGMAPVAASTNTWFGGGQWFFDTATGGPREVVAGPVSDGLGFVALHNVLFGGEQFADAVVGSAYTVQVDPYPASVTLARVPGSSPLAATGEWTVTFESAKTLPEGLGALTFGVGRLREYPDRLTLQDDPNDICTASFMMPLHIASGGGALNLATTSAVPGLDIDMFLAGDDGDGQFNCEEDAILGGSFTASADETINAKMLPGGQYFALVHGWSVPGGSASFDLSVQVIDGQDLTVKNLPSGPVTAGTPVTFQVEVRTLYVPGTHDALLYIGPTDAPLALPVPVTVEIPPAADAFRVWLPATR